MDNRSAPWYIKDATQRLEVFLAEATKRKLDFILQGGDFCHPTAEARPFVQRWNEYPGERYHVLGNHDMDLGTKEDIMNLWGMKKKYYSFDKGDFHFVVLDCNYILKNGQYIDYAKSNYYIDQQNRDLVNPEQIEWLKKESNPLLFHTRLLMKYGMAGVCLTDLWFAK